jgi:hypothetical protein
VPTPEISRLRTSASTFPQRISFALSGLQDKISVFAGIRYSSGPMVGSYVALIVVYLTLGPKGVSDTSEYQTFFL